MRRFLKLLAVIVAGVGFLILASYFTTGRYWDGGYPSGEFRIKIVTADGAPVQGAVLRVFRHGKDQPSFDYPLDNYRDGHNLVSDEYGCMTAIRQHGGLQFGGYAWDLLWVIPMGAKAPNFDCEISADGYETQQFPIWELFESPHKSYEEFPKVKRKIGENEIELKIYEHTFTMKRDRA